MSISDTAIAIIVGIALAVAGLVWVAFILWALIYLGA